MLPTKYPRPLESPARMAEELSGKEDVYEIQDVDMGVIDDLGTEVNLCCSHPR